MGFTSRLKNKLFPDETDVLYHEKKKTENKNDEKSSSLTKYKPTEFSQTQIIADKLRGFNNVCVDISELNKTDAMRMIDFLGGVMYAMDGDMKKDSAKEFTFIVKKEEENLKTKG